MMTDKEVEEIRARCDKATPGPWRWIKSCGYIMAPDGKREVQIGVIGAFRDKDLLPFNKSRWSADADMATRARTDIPALLSDRKALQDRVRELEGALHSAIDMTVNCPGVPKEPDSLPQMLLHTFRAALKETQHG